MQYMKLSSVASAAPRANTCAEDGYIPYLSLGRVIHTQDNSVLVTAIVTKCSHLLEMFSFVLWRGRRQV